MNKETLNFCYPPPPKNYKISSALSYNFKSALTGDAAIPGNEDLYEDALAKNDALEESISELEAVESAMREFAVEQINAWGKVRELLQSPITFNPGDIDVYGLHARDEVNKLEEHYKRGTGEQQ